MEQEKSTAIEEHGSTSFNEESLKAICLQHGNLIDKVTLKVKNSKGKTKLFTKWQGSLDELKDFVSLVLRKPGNWSEEKIKRSSVTFKSTNLTLTYYTTTLTVQFQGSKASESITLIKSLKDMHPKSNSVVQCN